MKKVTLSLIALLAVGSFAGAQATVGATMSASASVAYSWDLANSVGNFTNTGLYTLFVPVVGNGEKKGEGDVYGVITLTGNNYSIRKDNSTTPTLFFNNDSDATVSAKIVAGDLEIYLAPVPPFGDNYATMLAPLSVSSWADSSKKSSILPTTINGGIGFGMNLHDFGVIHLDLASTKRVNASDATYTLPLTIQTSATAITVSTADAAVAKYWSYATGLVYAAGAVIPKDTVFLQATANNAAVTVNNGGQYVVGGDATLNLIPGLLTLKGNGLFDAATSRVGYGAQGIVNLDPIKLTVGFDSQAASTFTADASGALEVNFAPISIGAIVYNDLTTTSSPLQYAATFGLKGGEIIPGVNFSGYYKNWATTATDATRGGVGASVDLTVEGIMVYAAGDYALTSGNKAYKAGVTTGMISNITLTAEYAAGTVVSDAFGAASITTPTGGFTNATLGLVTVTISAKM